MAKRKKLLDLVLVAEPTLTRERAFALILAGSIVVDHSIIRNPKELTSNESEIIIQLKKFVSRGGYKLQKALDDFGIYCSHKVVLDAGASAGGFTDCLLQSGAASVYAVDVGYNQIDFKLRQDPRVEVMEKTNIKDVGLLDPLPHFAVADLSFRSLSPILGHLLNLTQEKWAIVLFKPQFELTAEQQVGFDGIVRDPALIRELLERFYNQTVQIGITITHFCESPVRGGKGNREFLVRVCQMEDAEKQIPLENIISLID